MYSIDGVKELDETELDHLDGYRGSQPVRVGNGAYDHLQLDIYGELMDGIYLYNKYGSPISYDIWCSVRKLTNYVCANWNQPDMSIWEVRGRKQHFTYSLVMCWVAIDRGKIHIFCFFFFFNHILLKLLDWQIKEYFLVRIEINGCPYEMRYMNSSKSAAITKKCNPLP